MPDQLEPQLRDELQGAGAPPAWLYERLATTIRVTPQTRPSLLTGRALAAIAAVIVVAVLATGGPLLYSTVTAPRGSATPAVTSNATPTPSPSAVASPRSAATPLPTPGGNPDRTFDLRGTFWRLLDLPGQPRETLNSDTTPTLEFSLLGDDHHVGYSGCAYFGLTATFSGGQISGLALGQQDPVCRALATRDAFMPILAAATGWGVYPNGFALPGDVLVLTGPAGTLQFLRNQPSGGPFVQTLSGTLRSGQWRITSATGVRAPEVFAPLIFGDRQYISPGKCGIAGRISEADSALYFTAGFDTIACGPNDERGALARVLNAVISERIESPTTIRLTGPFGDVVLTRAGPVPPPASPMPTASPGAMSIQPTSVTFLDGQRGVLGALVGGPQEIMAGGLLRTADGGRTWTLTARSAGSIEQVTSLPGTTNVWAIAGCADGGAVCPQLLHSGDAGATWTATEAPWLRWVSFVDARHGWAVFGAYMDPQGSALRRTADGGATWTEAASNPCADRVGWFLESLAFNGTTGLVLCVREPGGPLQPKEIFQTTDDGATWRLQSSVGDPVRFGSDGVETLGIEGSSGRLGLAADGTAWMTYVRMSPQRSVDGGVTWAPLGLGDPDTNIVVADWCLERQRGFALLWNGDAQAIALESTTDGGRSWAVVTRWPLADT